MKKVGVALFVFVLMASLLVFVSAAENTTTNTSVNSSVLPKGFDSAFSCLDTTLKTDCSGAKTVEELSLVVLASSNSSKQCLTKLKEMKKAENCWGQSGCTVKETAMAILALDHAGEDTTAAENWLLTKNKTSSDLIWYLQQDSNVASGCKFSYGGESYNVQVYDNKKISGLAGPCLSLASGSFWLQIAPKCYNEIFEISCDQDFIASMFYQQRGSSTFYILSDTPSSPKLETITLSPKSFCFGDSSSCSYIGTAWATLALLKTGHEVGDFIPYLIAMEETNKQYLSKAFSYIVTEDDEYALQLIADKGALNDFWLAEKSVNDRYYDTALAYLSISGVSTEVDGKVRKWFEYSQEDNGCWSGSSSSVVKDTAMVLWALEGRRFSGGSVNVASTTRCEEAKYFCMAKSECVVGSDVSDNYFCGGLTKNTCCTDSNLKSCSVLEGEVCREGYVCDAGIQDSLEGSCCLGECEEAPEESACESEGFFCRDSCTASQTEKDFDCGDSSVCCGSATKKSSNGWIWILIVLIILVLGAIGWIYREKLKLWLFKTKTKFGKDKGKGSSSPSRPSGGLPPKPGFPPIRAPPMNRPMPPRPVNNSPARGQLDDVFKKLHEISK